jgi:hypothetical protein
MSKKIIVFPILVLALVACHKPTNTPQFVCYYYNSSVSLPASDDMPEMSSQIYRDIECPLPTNEAWTKIYDHIVAEFLNDTISNQARFDTADLQKLYEYPAVVKKDTESTYAYRHNDYISLRTYHLDDSIYGYYCHTKWYDLGAHGTEGYYYRYFDTRTGEPISIESLAIDVSAVSAYLDSHIRQSDKAWGILVDTILPNNNFIISDRGLTFVYNQYDIACFATDTIMCFVPLSEILQGQEVK